MNASVTLRGLLRKYITSQVSPALATHPARRSTAAQKKAKRRRYVSMTAPSIAEACPAKTDNHFCGATRRARRTNRPNMLLCWTSTNAAIAAANTATPISVTRATAVAASEFDRVASRVTPAKTKIS
jgi:anti-sigma factor RsiW